MPRWISVAAMVAASAFVAPVGSHYLSAKNATPTAAMVENGRQAPVAAPVRSIRRTAPKDAGALKTPSPISKTPSMLQTLQDGERDATAEGRQDIADLICGYTHEAVDDASATCKSGPIKNAEVMIATVPDPVHTRLALRFDREIDVVEEELQQLGWTYDRSWLPWDGTTHKAPDRWETRAFDSHAQNALELLPGVLLFRRNGGTDSAEAGGQNSPGDLLVVLLVGEQPTVGINAGQFAQALTYWQQPETLLNAKPCTWGVDLDCPVPSDLTILGPSFSGSLQSLDTMLRKHFAPWPDSPFSLRIASGSISDGEAFRSLELPYKQSKVSVHVASFYPASVDLSRGLFRYLRERHPGLKVAQVREKESGFGSIRDPLADPCAAAKKASPSGEKRCEPGLQIGNFHYPREISQLRRAYEQNGIIGFSDAAGAPRNQLQLSTAQDDGGSDSVAMFAGPVDAVALEADLAALTHQLTAEDYSVVLLSGTDVMDEIFIARYLSQRAPNITVIIQDTDQLFLHEGADASLNNVYVASSWPLVLQNGHWSATDASAEGTNMRFASAVNQGVATALHVLLCSAAATDSCAATTFEGYRSPFAGLDPEDTATASPPVWLSLIENGSFLPVALVDLAPRAGNASRVNLPAINGYDGGETPAVKAAGIRTVTGLPVKVLAVAIIGLLLWHGWACYTCRLDRSTAWTYALAEKEHHRIRLWIKSSLSLLAALALAVLFVPAVAGAEVQSRAFQGLLIVGQLVAVIISNLSIRKLADYEVFPLPVACTAAFGTLCLYMLLVADYFLWPLLAPSGNGSEYRFFLYRVADPFSGGSPAMPLLLMTAAATLLLHGFFSRLAFFGHRIPKLPDGFDYVRCPSNGSAKPLTSLLANVGDRRRRRALYLCACVMVLLFCISEHHRVLSLAKSPFDDLMTLSTVVVGAIILQNLFIACLAWRGLRHKILIPLKQSPLRWGFNWVKDFSWRRIWRSSKTLSSTQVFDYLFRLLQASSRRTGSGTGPKYYQSICALYLAADAGASPHDFTQGVEVIQHRMREEAQARLQKLQYEWQSDRGPLTGSKEVDRGVHLLEGVAEVKGKDRLGMLRRMGDEEFVALIYVGYISMVLIQIRQRIVTAAALYILLLWSLTNYPWMYRNTILLLLVGFFTVLSVTTVFIYSGMHRDEILSRTTETETGKLDGGFLLRVFAVLGVPLLTLVASQFPEVNSFVFSWLTPSLSKLP